MRKSVYIYLSLILVLSLPFVAAAEEGMFLLNELPKNLKGLHLDADQIYNVGGGGISDAVIIIDGGTGSFVSPNGLILTNHHVAYDAIQKNSDPEHNYLESGFYAKNLTEELPAPGYQAYITVGFHDITDRVLSSVTPGMTSLERSEAIDKKTTEIEKENDKPEEGTSGRVVSMLDGSAYYLFTYVEFKDVRLVYAPPVAIGEYGGDIDNWMWPRHTGDFSFMRVYVGEDGIPAEYSESNVPYKSETFLPFCSKGFKRGDFAFILGYPGSTVRYRTSNSVDWNQNRSLPMRIYLFQSLIDLFEKESKQSEDLKIKFSSNIKMFNNAMKNNQGMVEGLAKSKLLARKKIRERKFTNYLKQNPDLDAQYGDVLPSIKNLYDDLAVGFECDQYIRYLTLVNTLNFATTIQKWSEEKAKPDSEREPGYYDFQIPRVKKRMELSERDYHAPTDAKMLMWFLCKILGLPADQHPEFIRDIIANKKGNEQRDAIHDFVDNIYANTKLTDPEERMNMFDMSEEELNSVNDPFIEFAKEVNKELDKNRDKNDAFNGAITKLRPQYFEALKLWKGSDMYPDANRTLRFTYGKIAGYKPRDAVYYKHITGLKGVIEKHTGQEPFNTPAKLIKLYRKRDFGKYIDKDIKDVPVAFTATTDITGGNSGSPILNGKGEIIGCAFDGNYESMTSDWQFSNALTRTISVDSRYILFILDKFSNTEVLLDELTIH